MFAPSFLDTASVAVFFFYRGLGLGCAILGRKRVHFYRSRNLPLTLVLCVADECEGCVGRGLVRETRLSLARLLAGEKMPAYRLRYFLEKESVCPLVFGHGECCCLFFLLSRLSCCGCEIRRRARQIKYTFYIDPETAIIDTRSGTRRSSSCCGSALHTACT